MKEMCEVKDIPLHPFLWMGCWNTVGAPRDRVLDAITANPVEKVLLAGDNVYPLKKGEPHELSVFIDGMRKLIRSKTILTSALGNHNIHELGMEYFQRGFFHYPSRKELYFCQRYTDCASIILDSNIMDDKRKVERMRDFLLETLGALGETPYYIIQHEPFASYKKTKDPILPNGDLLLRAMKAHPPLAILCADTHNYQEGVLDVEGVPIRQIIVGTGGAPFDNFRFNSPAPLIIDETPDKTPLITYTLDASIPTTLYEKFGYYLMYGPGAGAFIPVVPWAGGRRSTRRRRNRRRSLRKRV